MAAEVGAGGVGRSWVEVQRPPEYVEVALEYWNGE
jgi:hypothetical protein